MTGKLCACRADGRNDELDYATDCHVILGFNKLLDDLLDDLLDGSIPKKLAAAALLPAVYLLYYRKAKKARGGLARAVRRAVREQRKAERSGTRSLDRLSEPTASMMRAVFCELGGCDPDLRGELGRLGYMLGRYVYICDALDDLEADAKNGDVNPFLPGRCRIPDDDVRERAERNAEAAANLTLGELAAVYTSLPENGMKPITDNIVYLGLRRTIKDIAEKKRKKYRN